MSSRPVKSEETTTGFYSIPATYGPGKSEETTTTLKPITDTTPTVEKITDTTTTVKQSIAKNRFRQILTEITM